MQSMILGYCTWEVTLLESVEHSLCLMLNCVLVLSAYLIENIVCVNRKISFFSLIVYTIEKTVCLTRPIMARDMKCKEILV